VPVEACVLWEERVLSLRHALRELVVERAPRFSKRLRNPALAGRRPLEWSARCAKWATPRTEPTL
jgi:hypothetical protein